MSVVLDALLELQDDDGPVDSIRVMGP